MPLELNNLYQGSYKRIPFLTPSSSVSGGRKDVLHEFPNKNTQTVEDLGLRPRSYQITAIISGDNYIRSRDRLLQALEDGESGTLVHPWYGSIPDVVCRSYTVTEAENNLGVASFTIQFAINNSVGLPVRTGGNLDKLRVRNRGLLGLINNLIASQHTVSTSFIGNFDAAKNQILQAVDLFDIAAQVLPASAAKINAFKSLINSITRDVNSLTVNPSGLANSITQLSSDFSELYSDADSQSFASAQLFNFGANDVAIPRDTAGRIERDDTANVFRASINTLALGQSYVSAAERDYGNERELDTAAEELEQQFDYIDTQPGLDDDSKQSLIDFRKETQQFFDQAELRVSQIVQTRTNTLPIRVISYQYYKDSSRAQELVDLNQAKDISFINGEIEVLSS